ncbi:MAG: hypothetical protein JSR31_07640 [Nitrospira sp.]|nr:hypothetical protein [Nitrospira sp.]
MSKAVDQVYALLPVVHRQRDEEAGEPLKALLSVIAEQIGIVEQDMTRLYENWFIETCDDWVIPYLGDVVGYRPAPEIRERGFVDYESPDTQGAVFVSRREVANALRFRRRKGSLALLELLAGDVAGWPARAVEFYRLVAGTHGVKHHVMSWNTMIDLRRGDELDLLNTPFDVLPHTVDVRRLASRLSPGRYNPTHVGLFVWRVRSYPVGRTEAAAVDMAKGRYRFDAFGHDIPLYTLPIEEPEPTHIADETNLPVPIRRRALRDRLADYYGEGKKSFCIWIDGVKKPVDLKDLVSADLSHWNYSFGKSQPAVVVDPELGRMLFAHPPQTVQVAYHYGFSADVGGGEYDRSMIHVVGKVGTTVPNPRPYQVSAGQNLIATLQQWQASQPTHAVIEIPSSGKFDVGAVSLSLGPNQSLHLRAANRARPVIRGAVTVTVEYGSRLTLDGLLLDGTLLVQGRQDITQAEVQLRHCTLAPGKGQDASPSLMLTRLGKKAVIDSSIVGPVLVSQHEVRTEPIHIRVINSIIDAGGDEATAVGAPNHEVAHAVLCIERSTILGQVQVHAIDSAADAIFTGAIHVDRRQRGALRFCYVPAESRTPSRHQCQPDLAEQEAERQLRTKQPAATPEDVVVARQATRDRMRPSFTSRQHGMATYCQLSASCRSEIVRGAEDEGELGIFHDLHHPQRLANLEGRLNEYIPAGMEAGVILAS